MRIEALEPKFKLFNIFSKVKKYLPFVVFVRNFFIPLSDQNKKL